jgi:putative aldouronate transport system substrate-binding protein
MPKKTIVIILTMILAAAVTLPVMSAGQEDKEQTEAGPVKMQVMMSVNVNYPYKEDWLVFNELEERGNAELDFILVPDSDYVTKKKLTVASGDMPDMILKVATQDSAEYLQWATEDILFPFNKYIDKLPNFTKRVEEYKFQPEIDELTQVDGNYYILPQMYETPWQKIGFVMRGDILEKHSLQVPETLEGLTDLLKTVKSKEPDMIPFACAYQMNLMFLSFGPLFGTQAGWGGGPTQYDFDGEQWEAAMTNDGMKAMIEYFNNWWDEGLMSVEQFVAENSQMNNLLDTGKVFMSILWSPSVTKKASLLQENTGNNDAHWIMVPPFTGGPGKAGVYAPKRHAWGAIMPDYLATDSRLDRILEFTDWAFYSDEGVLINLYGKEGVTYNLDNGKLVFLDKFKTAGIPDLQQLKKDYGIDTNGWNQVVTLDFLTVALNDQLKDYYKILQDKDMYVSTNPVITFTTEEKEDAKLMETPLQDYRNEMMIKFIMGATQWNTGWESYVRESKKKGLDDLTEIYNQAWERQN